MCVTSGAGTAYPSGAPDFTIGFGFFGEICVARSLDLCVVFYRSLFVFLHFLFWPLCCLSLFDLRFLIIPLVSSKSSHRGHHQKRTELRLFLIFSDNLEVVLDFL